MRALVLVAHADDETLGCGGTIDRLTSAGDWQVQVVVVTDGRITAQRDNVEACEAACEFLGTSRPEFLKYADQKLDSYSLPAIVDSVEGTVGDCDLILTHATTDLNRDHVVVSEVARLIARRRPVTVLGCEIPNGTVWAGEPFPAQLYVTLSREQVQAKCGAFEMYENEVRHHPDPMALESLWTLASLRGIESGTEFAEAFQLIRGIVS